MGPGTSQLVAPNGPGRVEGPERKPASPDRIPALVLVEAGLPAPPGAVVGPVRSGGAILRAARWMAPVGPFDRSPGTVLICTGRSEFIEKYFEVVGELQARGFAVVVFDWRGQGLSGRSLRNPRKGHVVHFADYESDLLAVADQVLAPFCPRPWFGLAHSMGGAVALAAAADRPDLFRRLVLSAPMVRLARLRFEPTLRFVARLLRLGGFGRAFVPGGRGRAGLFRSFERNALTSDPDRHARVLACLQAEPRLTLGPPTVGWVHAAFEAMARLDAPGLPARLATPVLAVVPGFDRVVDPRATERLVTRLRGGRVVGVPGCRHEVLMERDVFREQFWAAFDAFVPGSSC